MSNLYNIQILIIIILIIPTKQLITPLTKPHSSLASHYLPKITKLPSTQIGYKHYPHPSLITLKCSPDPPPPPEKKTPLNRLLGESLCNDQRMSGGGVKAVVSTPAKAFYLLPP